jgi:Ca2+-binding EF-hand superfamily protein
MTPSSSIRALAIASGLTLGLMAGACAQAAPSAQHAQPMQQAREPLHQRFVAADKDGNGQLTRAEAQAGMPRVYRAFDQIDTARKGYVTEAEITTAIVARLASRRSMQTQ